MVLSDRTIRLEVARGRIAIEPLDPEDIQPSSVDLHLGDDFQVFRNSRLPYIDPSIEQSGLTDQVFASAAEPFVLHPGEFALGTTIERIELPHDLVGRLEGKSSLGRLGLLIHSTAGYVDPGWKRPADSGALKRGESPDRAESRDEDRADLVLADDHRGRPPVRTPRVGEQVPGAGQRDAEQDVPQPSLGDAVSTRHRRMRTDRHRPR